MDWQQFLKQKAIELELSPELTDTLLTIFPEPTRSLAINEVSIKLSISESTVKNHRLKPIYEKFDVGSNGRGKLEGLRQKLGQEFHQSNSVVNPGTNNNKKSREFQSLIEEKLKRFCGRKFVFKAFGDFIKNTPAATS
ncbi:MAG: hypothetical protein R6U67_15400 [Sodalinema sp.]|uniref:hypothetical protein n=1 Tax=Sodalinema sp. TaxID=3080550 RepID=UPI00396F6A64